MDTIVPKKRLLSGMQPTGAGKLHLGNYEGALKAWVALQDRYEMFCFVADWHALTTLAGTGQSIVADARSIALDYLSAGLDPEKCAIFLQSEVPQHAELFLLLGMLTPVSWLERVPTYKERREIVAEREGGEAGVSFGLLGYPVLQAADILVYRAHSVPVGKDQAAHLELSREIARRFNHLYQTDLFPEPQALISEDTGTLIGLDGRKMSKSYDNAIYLTDTADDINAKMKKAFTTPTRQRMSDPGVPEGCSVCQLRRLYDPEGYTVQWEECRAATRGCVQSKKETADILNAALEPLRERRKLYADDPAQLDRILAQGAEKARDTAEATLREVRRLMKLV
ncbi:MAG: tryptophan--tRNA ligase [Armatimonadetes bacterium]|nr:tryptophan--tRNA ligase [Armatimonadota bacterium]